MNTNTVAMFVLLSLALGAAVLSPTLANAHCDTMNGPVVKAAQKALESNDVNLVLIWVQPQDEAVIREAFARTVAVRTVSPEVKNLVDMYFFETLVRIHRAGEGVAYTGLKPADTEVEPGIVAADEALEKGSVEEMMGRLKEAIDHGVRRQFEAAMKKRTFDASNIAAGREYVKAYVEFIHYTERLFNATSAPVEGHFQNAGEAGEEGHLD